eukprot:SAG11_NODE_28826_length_317_cov_1.174312_1_plen_61_part_01
MWRGLAALERDCLLATAIHDPLRVVLHKLGQREAERTACSRRAIKKGTSLNTETSFSYYYL